MRDIVYSIKAPEHMFFDLDSTLLNTYGKQEGEGFNFHYQAHGYHPLFCYDGITGDLLKAELRNDTQYCSNDADKFVIPLLQEYRAKYPSLPFIFVVIAVLLLLIYTRLAKIMTVSMQSA